MINRSFIKKIIALIVCVMTLTTSFTVLSFGSDTSSKALPTPAEIYGKLPREVIVNAGKDEQSCNVTWNTYSGEKQYVQFVKYGGIGIPDVFPAGYLSVEPAVEDGDDGMIICRAKITGLESDSAYLYRVGSKKDGWSETALIKTGVFDDGAFTFLLAGDPQIGATFREDDGDNWNTTLEKARTWFGDRIEFLMVAGDQIDYFAWPEQFENYTAPEMLHGLRQINTPGNHDNNGCYSEHFTFDDVDQDTTAEAGEYGGDYWTAYDGVLICSLNTNDLSGTLHRSFIEKAISEYTEKYGEPNWKIVMFHHSIFSGAEKRYDETYRREKLAGVFSELGIDAVLTGHDHIYTRTYMINGLDPVDDVSHYKTVGGDAYGSIYDPTDGEVFYLTVNSASGSKYYTMYYDELPYAAYKNQESTPNITKVDVTADCMTFTTYRTSATNDIGDVVDFFAIHHADKTSQDVYSPFLDVPTESTVYTDEEFDPMDGVFAYDDRDGDLTGKVTVTGKFDPAKPSVLTYSVTDSAGNVTRAKRKIVPATVTRCVLPDTEWKYLDDGTLPFEEEGDESVWTRIDFDDGDWKTGVSSFGAKLDGPGVHSGKTPNTAISLYYPVGSDDEGGVIPNYFFRTSFDVDDPENVDFLTLDLWYDDAVDVYINGVKLKAVNTGYADGMVGYCGNKSPGNAACGSFVIDDKATIGSLGLKKSGNVIAIELFQTSSESEDIYFEFGGLTAGTYVKQPDEEVYVNPFTDVPANSWFTRGVLYCNQNGFMKGTSDKLFSPDVTFTRAMFVTVLSKIDGSMIKHYPESSFYDVEPGRWYSDAVQWAYSNKYAAGVGGGRFAPDDPVTREQLAVFLRNFAKRNGRAVNGSADLSAFRDRKSVSAYALESVKWAVANKLISGTSKDTLTPGGYATRAQVSVIIKEFTENVYNS